MHSLYTVTVVAWQVDLHPIALSYSLVFWSYIDIVAFSAAGILLLPIVYCRMGLRKANNHRVGRLYKSRYAMYVIHHKYPNISK